MGVSIQHVLGSSVLDSVKGIIWQFQMSPEDKAKLQAQLDAEKDQFATAGERLQREAERHRWPEHSR